MNTDIVKGNWKEIKGKVSQQWNKITDDSIAQMSGNFEELSGKLQKTYGYTKEQAKKEVDAFLSKNNCNDSSDSYANKASQAFDNIKDKITETRESFTHAASDAKDKAGDVLQQSYKEVKEKTADLQENVISYVKENPAKSVGFALLAGILAAKLLRD